MRVAEDKPTVPAVGGMVAAAEQEILDDLLAAAEASSNAERTASAGQHPIVAAILIAACLAFTAFNLTYASWAAGDPAQQRRNAIEALELFAGDIEAYRRLTGTYPVAFDNPFEDDSWLYERITPDHFRLTVAQDGNELTYDSRAAVAGQGVDSASRREGSQ